MSNVSPKVTASALAAAIVSILVWVASTAGIDLPIAVQGALMVIVVFAAGYLKIDPRRS
jgi:hypothetical protein